MLTVKNVLLTASATTQSEIYCEILFKKLIVAEYQLFYTVTAQFSVKVFSNRIALLLLTDLCVLEYQLLLLYKVFLTVNSYFLVLNVFFHIVFLKVIFFSMSYSLLHHLYLPYDLFLNESVFITIIIFLLLAKVVILTILLAGWKIAA